MSESQPAHTDAPLLSIVHTGIRIIHGWPWQYWLCGVILAFLLIPWPVPAELKVLNRFDPALVTVNERGYLPRSGRIELEPHMLRILASPQSQPTVHLLTTEGDFKARFTVRVVQVTSGDVYPVQIKLWNPSKDVAMEAWFGSASTSSIHTGYRIHDRWIANSPIGTYEIGEPVTVDVWRSRRDAGIHLTTPRWDKLLRVTPADFLPLFSQDTLSVTAYASSPGNGSAKAAYGSYEVIVPGAGPYGVVLAGSSARVLAFALWLGIVFGLASEALRRNRPPDRRSAGRSSMSLLRRSILPVMIVLVAGVAVPLSLVGSHPYDMYSNQLWAYVAAEYGLPGLYTVASIGTEGFSHGGDPYAAAAFPYPPVIGYVFKAAGDVYRAMGGEAWMGDPRLMVGLKFSYLTFHLLGALLVYRLLVRVEIPDRVRIAAFIAYIFNPAILFGAVVWGQNDTILLFMLLVAFVGIEERKPALAWFGILAAATVKQTGLPLSLILAALLARRVGARNLLAGLARSSLWFFLLVAPLIWSGIHPISLIYPTWSKFLQFGTVRWMEASNAVVARDGFNLWTLVTYFANARGVERMAFPDFAPLPWLPITYINGARMLTAGLVGYIGLLLLSRSPHSVNKASKLGPKESEPPAWQGTLARLLAMATYSLGVVFLSTRMTERYYTFGLAFLGICVPFPGARFWLAYAAMTVAAVVAMYGSLVQIGTWYPGLLPRLVPDGHYLNALVLRVYTSDIWISVFSTLTLLVVVWLLISLRKAEMSRSNGDL